MHCTEYRSREQKKVRIWGKKNRASPAFASNIRGTESKDSRYIVKPMHCNELGSREQKKVGIGVRRAEVHPHLLAHSR